MEMVHTTNVDGELAAELADVAEANGCELIHAEFRGGTLQLLLDRPDGGVTLKDCETVSKEVSALLDVVDFGRGRYTLEVSSPGLDRPLFGADDYERFRGHLTRVTYRDREDGRKKTVVGRIEELRDALNGTPGQEVVLQETNPEKRVTIVLADIQKARLEIEL